MKHSEKHNAHRVGWLRAAVLGANDGIVSTASLVIGVAAASAARGEVLTAGVAGLVAGAMSMAAGEYVSVSSQADTERADLERERRELRASPTEEAAELADIYVGRGLDPDLAKKVSAQLTAHDALGAHARDELGITDGGAARPVQAALSSAAMFALGAALPLLAFMLCPLSWALPVVVATSLSSLALLGVVSARLGGARVWVAVMRVSFWGALAMGLTAGIGALFGTVV
ncbi:MAG: VIT family protein [Polyangiales bacterium]